MARVTSLETKAASCSSSPDSARSWNLLGQSNGSTATGSLGSHGPGSSDDNRNTRRRLGISISPEDEYARSAVRLRFTCEQYHTGRKNPTFQSIINPSEFIAKQFPYFVARFKYDGISYEGDSPFRNVKTGIAFRQSESLEDREIGKQFAPLWKVLAEQLKVLFPGGDGAGARRPFTSSLDSCLLLLHLTCAFLVFLVKCCNGSSLKPARLCRLSAFSPPGRSRRIFPRFPVSMGSTPCIIFDSQLNRACCYALLQGGSSI